MKVKSTFTRGLILVFLVAPKAFALVLVLHHCKLLSIYTFEPFMMILSAELPFCLC